MFVSHPVSKLFAVLVFFVSLLSGSAQEEEANDSSLMTNYNAMREDGQGFFLLNNAYLHEKPTSTDGSFVALQWYCDLKFSSDDDTNYGYVGRAVQHLLGSTLEDVLAQGGSIPSSDKFPLSVSAVFVPTLGIFEGQIHPTFDDLVIRYWDDGNSTLPILGWEGHDEGDTSPNADTSAFSGSGTSTKITTEKAAKYLGMDVAKLTPATCSKQYKEAWNLMRMPDRTNITVATLEGDITQLQADNSQLLLRCCD